MPRGDVKGRITRPTLNEKVDQTWRAALCARMGVPFTLSDADGTSEYYPAPTGGRSAKRLHVKDLGEKICKCEGARQGNDWVTITRRGGMVQGGELRLPRCTTCGKCRRVPKAARGRDTRCTICRDELGNGGRDATQRCYLTGETAHKRERCKKGKSKEHEFMFASQVFKSESTSRADKAIWLSPNATAALRLNNLCGEAASRLGKLKTDYNHAVETAKGAGREEVIPAFYDPTKASDLDDLTDDQDLVGYEREQIENRVGGGSEGGAEGAGGWDGDADEGEGEDGGEEAGVEGEDDGDVVGAGGELIPNRSRKGVHPPKKESGRKTKP